MAKRGRKSTYTNAAADEICARLAAGESLRSICQDEHLPPAPTVRSWVVDDRFGFAERYARAFDIGMDEMADQLLEIADTPRLGIKTENGKDGVKTVEADMIEHRRLQVDARKWLLAKRAANRYGERQKIEHSGTVTLESLVLGEADE